MTMSTAFSPRQYLPGRDRLHPFGDTAYIDVTDPPYGADPTGQRDSTDAIVRAIDAVAGITADAFAQTVREIEALPGDGHLPSGVENRKENGKVKGIFPSFLPYLPAIYFPAGRYLVSDTVSYTLDDLKNSMGSELNRQLRLYGDGADKSVIQLADNAPGFAGDEPKPVVTLMRGRRSNVSMSNYFKDLTIDTGKGNPAAIGLDFFANNSGAVRDVVIRSGDGRGAVGLQLDHGALTGVLIDRVRIEGFDTGMNLASGAYAVAEHVTMTGQRKCGIYVAGPACASFRDIRSDAAAPALVSDDPRALVTLLDSELAGEGAGAIDHRQGALYAAGVTVRGFAAVLCGDVPAEALAEVETRGRDKLVKQLALPRAFAFDDGEPMPRLPVEDPPRYDGLRDGEQSCGVRAFGAKGDGQHDDAPAIQQAMDSGAAEVIFEPGHYLIDQPVTIPASVRRVNFRFVDLVAGDTLCVTPGQGAFVITGESDEPLFLEDLFAWELWRGQHHTFEHASRRTVVIRDMHAQTSPLYNNSVPGGKVFIDNICCTTGVVPGASGHGRACVSFHGQRVWTRQLNPERGEPMVLNDGGDLWVLGFKTEDCGVAFHTINGGRSEILGGMLFSGRPHATAFVTEDSETRLTAASSGGVPEGCYGIAIDERRGGQSQTLPASELPLRGYPPERGPQFHLPLFVSTRR
ncbi:MAG: glycosyl hydrolase family 28-related protein [Phycisphaeraceae bacterium]